MPPDIPEMDAGSGPDAAEKPAGKTRLLSLHDIDRRTAAYRKTADLIDAIENDLGGPDHSTCSVDRRAARGSGGAVALRGANRSRAVRDAGQCAAPAIRDCRPEAP